MTHGVRGSALTQRSVAVALALGVAFLGLSLPDRAYAATADKITPAVVAAGSGITIAGTELAHTTGVTFLGGEGAEDDVEAAHFVVVDSKKVAVQVPATAVSGPVALTSGEATAVTPVPAAIVHRPVIEELSSTALPAGATLTVSGRDLLGVKKTTVLFNQAKATPLPTSTATSLQVIVPAGVRGGPVTLSVATEGGATYEDFAIAPSIKSITPATGTTTGGTVVTIVGSGFKGVDNFADDEETTQADERLDGVTIGGQRVRKLIAVSDTEIVAVTPAGDTGAAPVVVQTKGGGVQAASTSAVNFAYQPLPVVTALSQDWNPVAPSSPVAITASGKNLGADTRVTVGSLVVSDVETDEAAGTLTFTPPPAPKAGATKVTFTNTAGGVDYSATRPLTYVGPPTVVKLVPASGPAGTSVVVSGTGFVSGTTVTFGGTRATCAIVTVAQLRCVAPAGTDTSDVVVTTGTGASTPAATSHFTYTAGTPAPAPPVVTPAVTSMAPGYGTTGTTVAIGGANLHLATKVEFTGAEQAWVDAPQFLVVSPTRLVVTVPAGAASGLLRVTAPSGRVTSGFKTYAAGTKPVVSSIDVVGEATYGVAGGDILTIKGTGFLVGNVRPVVTVGGKVAPLLTRPVPTPRTLVVRIPASVGGREAVTVTTPLGASRAEANLYFTPQIKAIKPLSYDRAGGVAATISGSGFTGVDSLEEAAGGRLAGVTFAGVPVVGLVVISDKEIVAATANGSATVDRLLVRSQHGSWIGSSDEQVRATNLPQPTITGISPNLSVLGVPLSPVTITGTHLLETSTVYFGAAAADVLSAAADGTRMVVMPPARVTAATVPVTVTNVSLGEELTATLEAGYRYLPQPSVSTITPDVGFTGVTPAQVTITGTNLRANSVVRFGDTVGAVESVTADGTSLVVTPPLRNDAGPVDVSVTNLHDDEELVAIGPAPYTYRLRAYPTVSAVTPATAVAGEATTPVTISGTNLFAHSVVCFGAAAGTVVSAAEDGTSLQVEPPVGAAGTVAITVTNSGGDEDLDVTVPGAFRYIPVPSITALSPDSGTIGAAQPTVTISGKNLQANSVVRFGSTTAAIASVAANGTSLTVTPPVLSAPGPVDVTVTNIVDSEPYTATLSSGYTYLDAQSPTIATVSPATGTTGAANSTVTITGTKLRADSVVKFGAATAVVQTVAADGTSMEVTPPVSSTDGFVAVSVTNVVSGDELTSATANAYRYLPMPSVSTITPATGMTGGTPAQVTITGQNLRLNSVVRFGGSNAAVESAASDGSSVVVTPPVSNTAGSVNVTVTNIIDGSQELTATVSDGYRYAAAPATITGKSVGTGLPGTLVTLSGTSFSGVTSVRFGTTEAQFSIVNPTTMYVTVPLTPSGAQGAGVDIVVINSTGQPSIGTPATADDWTWASHPLVAAMSNATGIQGSQVTLTGSGFTDATAVRFGSIDATFTVINDTTAQVTVPTTPSAGSVADVTVVARGLVSPEPLTATANDWTWHAIAVITQLNPLPGDAGSTITITGRNFANVRSVTVNGTNVTSSVVVQSSTSLTFTAPPRPGGGSAGRTDKPVVITNGSGAGSTAETDPATGKPANLFTWE